MKLVDQLKAGGTASVKKKGSQIRDKAEPLGGQTTLLETLLGKRPQEAGKIRTGHDVKTAYFSQHEAELDERGTVLDACVSGTCL